MEKKKLTAVVDGQQQNFTAYRRNDTWVVRFSEIKKLFKESWRIAKWNPPGGKVRDDELAKELNIHCNEKFVLLDDAKGILNAGEELHVIEAKEQWFTFDGTIHFCQTYLYNGVWYVEYSVITKLLQEKPSQKRCLWVKPIRIPAINSQFGIHRNKKFISFGDLNKIALENEVDNEWGYVYSVPVTVKWGISTIEYKSAIISERQLDDLTELKKILCFDKNATIVITETKIPYPTRFKLALDSKISFCHNWVLYSPEFDLILENHCKQYDCYLEYLETNEFVY